MQWLSDAGTPNRAPKLDAQIKEELMQNNISHLIISSTQMRLHVLGHLSKTLKNVELKNCVCLVLQLRSVEMYHNVSFL